MARSRRRSSKPREKADWVYRGLDYDADTGLAQNSQVASYTGMTRNAFPYTIVPNAANGHILYDSSTYLTQGVRAIVGGAVSMQGRESRAEGRRPVILAVEIDVFYQPNAWTAGSDFLFGTRVIIADQNMITGGMDLPALYNMYGLGAPTLDSEPSVWANGWGNLAERTSRQAFSTENDMARFRMRYRWKGRRTLAPNLCLGLYVENAGPAALGTTLTYGLRCRTLVIDQNA